VTGELLFGAVVVVALVFFIRSRPGISGAEAQRLVAAGARLVDVRSPGEFASGHLPGAVNIPVGEVGRRTGELGPPDTTVVVYCASGMRSAAAASALRKQGFKAVHNLGGLGRWQS
jgi:rhodanese-related sulfurtransferase